jgi:hypothetical protein
MKRTVLIFLLLLLTYSIQAKKVEMQTAQNVGLAYYYEHVNQFFTVELKALNVTSVSTEFENILPIYYIFNINNNGFVIVSADDIATPVLGYSYETDFNSNEISPELKYWLNGVKKTIANAITNNLTATNEINNTWSYYMSRTSVNLNFTKDKTVAPLLTSTWDQGKYYNQLCPAATGGPDDKAYAGCVATSMGQIMYYYRYPNQGLGSHGGINFGATTYNWDNMLDNLNNYNDGIATLLYHAGKAVNMNYAADGSGAQTYDCPSALKNHFNYNSTCDYVSYDFDGYTQTTWQNLMKSNIDLGHPMIYSGFESGGSGHAWVCDGYDASNNFHMNWGWSGSANGYFAITNLTAGGYTFYEGHGLVYNIFPPSTSYPSNCTGTKTINFSTGTIEDGSGISNYQNNNDCLWLIEPTETVTKVILSFINFSTEATNDIVTVYDGNSTSSPVLGTFSGSTLPNNVLSTGPQMLVRFQTNGSVVNNGWKAYYRCYFPTYCSGITTLTTANGLIEDGSGSDNYSYNNLCRWSISPPNATSITIDFTTFNLVSNDYLKIYDQNTNALLAYYTGSTIPSSATYNISNVLLLFRSDNYLNSQGFSLNYTSNSLIGIDENSSLHGITIFPNPVKNYLILNIESIFTGNNNLSIYSIDGREVYSEIFDIKSVGRVKAIDVSNLTSGIYLLSVSNNRDRKFMKFIKE